MGPSGARDRSLNQEPSFAPKLDGCRNEVHERAVPDDGDRELASNGIGQHEAHERLRAGNGLARGREDEVTFMHAGLGGRCVGNDLHDAETELLPRPFRQTRRQRWGVPATPR